MNETDVSRGRLEVHLEELGQHSWWKALLNTITGTNGSAQYRFVARLAGSSDARDVHVREGATFPLLRWQDLNNEHQPNAFSDIAHQRLEELDASLCDDGWSRCEGPGRHWWSRTYEATRQRSRTGVWRTLHLKHGTPPRVLSTMLGHASVAITLDRYGHLCPGDVHLYVDRLGEVAPAARADYLRTSGVPGPSDWDR